MEGKLQKAFEAFTDKELRVSELEGEEEDSQGTYYPLAGMTKETQKQLIADHFLFKEGDRHLQYANACNFWPKVGEEREEEEGSAGSWHLSQQRQDLLDLGERGGPHEDHLHARGQRRRPGPRPSRPRHQGLSLSPSSKGAVNRVEGAVLAR